MRFMAIGNKVDVALGVQDLGIEEGSTHTINRRGQENATPGLVLNSCLHLPCEKWREKCAGVNGRPKRSLDSQGKRDAVISIEHELGDGAVGQSVLRQPNGLFGIEKIVQGVVLPADGDIDPLRQMDVIRNDERVLMRVLRKRNWAGLIR